MTNTPNGDAGSRAPRRRRSLNLTLIKRVIVVVVGVLTAFGSAVTGLGAQAAFAPMLTWMFGFKSDKAQATGLVFACVAACAAVAGAMIAHATAGSFWIRGIVLFVGALFGALCAGRIVSVAPSAGWRRWSLTLGIVICLFVLARIGKLSIFGTAEFARWRTLPALAGIACVTGAATKLLGLPSGLLLVPALYLFAGFTPSESISLSLLVIALASLVPAISYSRRGLMDKTYGAAAIVAALIGGAIGGRMLPPDPSHQLFAHRILIGISAAVAMFLCARELSRIGMADTDTR